MHVNQQPVEGNKAWLGRRREGSLQLFATDGPVLCCAVLRCAIDSRHRGDDGHQTATRPGQTRPTQANPIQRPLSAPLCCWYMRTHAQVR